jgi:hypothetical protein
MARLSNKAQKLASKQQKKEVVADVLKETTSPNDTANTQESVSEDEKPKGQKLEIKQNPEGTFEKQQAKVKALVLPSNRGSIVTDVKDLAKMAAIRIEGEKKRVALIAAHQAHLQASQELDDARVNDLFNTILEKHDILPNWVTAFEPDLSIIHYLIPKA